MRRIVSSLGGAISMVGLATAALAAAPTEPIPLDWLVGGWVHQQDNRWTEEWWTPSRAGLMLGASRSGTDDRLAEFEHLRIMSAPGGGSVYQAQPGGKPAVAFQEERRAANEVSFTNPDHDYPQRITYRRNGDTLTASISMMDGSRRLTWTYRRR